MERGEEKVVIGRRKGNDSAGEGWWMQHLWLTHAGERLCLEHVGQRGGGLGPFASCHLNAAGQFCIMRGQHVSQTLTQNKDHAARLIQHQLICHFAPLSLSCSVSCAAVVKGGGSSASVGSTVFAGAWGDYIELYDISNNNHWRCLLLVTFIQFFLTKIKCQLREQVLLSHHPSASFCPLCFSPASSPLSNPFSSRYPKLIPAPRS